MIKCVLIQSGLKTHYIIIFWYFDPYIYIIKEISSYRIRTNICLRFLLVPHRLVYKNKWIFELTGNFKIY